MKAYISEDSKAKFPHIVCSECNKNVLKPGLEAPREKTGLMNLLKIEMTDISLSRLRGRGQG